MTLDSDRFLALCKRLRKLGATQVSGYGFEATFGSTADKPTAAPRVAVVRSVPKHVAAAVPERVTPERQTELREAAYAKELGLV